MAGQGRIREGQVDTTLPPPRVKPTKPSSGCAGALLFLGALAALGYGGWRGYQYVFIGAGKASIGEVSLDETSRPTEPVVVVALTFHANPNEGDMTSVLVQIESDVFLKPLVVPWETIAVQNGKSKYEPPPLEVPIRVRAPVGLELRPGATLMKATVTVKLFWAGKQQDREELVLKGPKPVAPPG